MATTKEMEKFVEEHRHKYEPTQHWQARKQFMINNWNRFSGNQLVSLSMVWSNVEFDGATYPPELMARVKEMGEGIVVDDEYDQAVPQTKQARKPKPQTKPKEDPPQVADSKGALKRSHADDHGTGSHKVQRTEPQESAKEQAAIGVNDISRGRSDNSRQSVTVTSRSLWWPDEVIRDLVANLTKQTGSNRIGSALNRLHNAGLRSSLRPDVEFIEIPPPNLPRPVYGKRNSARMPRDNPSWRCNLYMGDILLACAEANNKPIAKTAAAEKATAILVSTKFYIKTTPQKSRAGRLYNKTVVSLDDNLNSKPFPVNKHNKVGAPPPTGTLEKFVLLEPVRQESAVTTLVNSAQSNHVQILFDTSDLVQKVNGKTGYVCTTVINGVAVGTGINMNPKEAKNVSASNALASLRQTCLTLRKNIASVPTNAIARDELGHGSATSRSEPEKPIEETNVGHKMLKMMGWSGGALGEGGITEPIKAADKISREGLGYTVEAPKDSNNKLDSKAVLRIMKEYVSSGRRDDLVFTSDLSIDERKAIHLMCRRFGLKSHSHGKGDQRFLIVGQKRSINTIVQDVVESGGACGHYEVILPNQK